MNKTDVKTVMIVDDTGFMRKKLRKLFEQNGHEVVAECEDGNEAVDAFQKHKPDIVTMDIVMPKMSGIAAVKALIELDEHAKIIMVSSLGLENKVMEAARAGASSFILKPFTSEQLMEAVDAVFEESQD